MAYSPNRLQSPVSPAYKPSFLNFAPILAQPQGVQLRRDPNQAASYEPPLGQIPLPI